MFASSAMAPFVCHDSEERRPICLIRVHKKNYCHKLLICLCISDAGVGISDNCMERERQELWNRIILMVAVEES